MTPITKALELVSLEMEQKNKAINLASNYIKDMTDLIRGAAEHDDPKRVLREFVAARPELFGERKP